MVHREGGPAIVYAAGGEEWYKNGQIHREDGPAIICDGVKSYYLNNVKWTVKEFWRYKRANNTELI